MPKRLARLLLLLGVLIGLATQNVALAAEPCPHAAHAQTSAMDGMDCCPEDEAPGHENAPCNEMTLACLAMAGCATAAALDADAITDSKGPRPDAPKFSALASTLYGRTIPPDTHPPAPLG